MADLSDVTAVLASSIADLIYPDGPTQASAIGIPCQICEGWPLPQALEAIAAKPGVTIAAPVSIVSVYPVPGTTSDGGTVLGLSNRIVSRQPAGLEVVVDGDVISFSGLCVGNEIATVLIDGTEAYSYICIEGDTPEMVAAKLAIDINAATAGSATWSPSGTLTIAGAISLAARIGSTAIVGRKVHRQKTQIRVVVWSSRQADRNAVAAAIDVFVKDALRFRMADTTDAILSYQGTNLNDNIQRDGLYRRDLIYTALFDTLVLAEATEVTNVAVRFTPTVTAP